jgi:hypothetical protein
MSKKDDTMALHVSRRELATILAALRFHQDENLQTGPDIPDRVIEEIATDGGRFKPLRFEEVDRLCQRLIDQEGPQSGAGLVIEPPPKQGGQESLYRVVYAIDVNAVDPSGAAKQTYRIMADPESLAPVLDVIDTRGHATRIDLSDESPSTQEGGVRHSRMEPKSKNVWVLAVTYKGTTVHTKAVSSMAKAVKALAEYLRAENGYAGPVKMSDICNWMAKHDERLGADIIHAPLDLS